MIMNCLNLTYKFEELFFNLICLLGTQPKKIGDITVMSMYKALLDVQDVEELDRWLGALEKTELSAFSPSSRNSGVDDCFGEIHALLMTATEDDKEEVVFLIMKIKEANFRRFYYSKDVQKCIDTSKRINKKDPDTIVLFRQRSNQYAAFDGDAEALYLNFGWELSSLELGGGTDCSFMYVNPKGFELLQKQDVKLVVMECDYPIDFHTRSVEGLTLADSQQMIDCFRSLITQESLVCSSGGLAYSPVVDGLECEKRFPFVFKNGESFGLYGEDGDAYDMIDGNGWHIDYEKIPLINNLAFNLSLLMMNKQKLKKEIGQEEVAYDMALADVLYMEYQVNKHAYPDVVLLMKSGKAVWTFCEDALDITRNHPRTIWKYGSQPLVFLNLDRLPLSFKEYNIVFVDSEHGVSFEKMRLKPHVLNVGVRSSVLFTNPRIFKTKLGDYAVQAEVDNRTIPMMRIPLDVSEEILTFPEGIMRESIIKSVLFGRLHFRYAFVTYA